VNQAVGCFTDLLGSFSLHEFLCHSQDSDTGRENIRRFWLPCTCILYGLDILSRHTMIMMAQTTPKVTSSYACPKPSSLRRSVRADHAAVCIACLGLCQLQQRRHRGILPLPTNSVGPYQSTETSRLLSTLSDFGASLSPDPSPRAFGAHCGGYAEVCGWPNGGSSGSTLRTMYPDQSFGHTFSITNPTPQRYG
jgi:hypothetical protein